MHGGEMTLFPDSQQVTIQPLQSPFERQIIPEMSFQQPITNNQFNMNLTDSNAVQGSLTCNIPVNSFNIPPIATNLTTSTNDMMNVDSFCNRLFNLDTQQSVDPNPDFSSSLLNNPSIMNIFNDNNNAGDEIEENMSDSLRNMKLVNHECQ